ncbi:uncharacterized protein LOC130969427 [Arachis stenosperma]|uniref:uncharacterized protein LOC130969427 n=1 Tax=Arachis stenosperma TaxID=217475 RepID=UPI0025ABE180|nr:uncharacterized protein LOC130969427 [Arachis stenosperma]
MVNKKKTRSGVKFTGKDPLSIFLKPTTSFADFLNSILQKLVLQGVKRVEKLFYRISISVLRDDVKYDSFVIGSDENLEVLFHCRRQFLEVKHLSCTVACSSSRPVGASSFVPVVAPQDEFVASSSFAVDLNRSGGGEVGIIDRAPILLQCGASAGMDDSLPDEDDTNDVESDIIADDSGDDIAASNPGGASGGFSSGIQQYPLHFSSLNLDAMRQEGIPREPFGFGARDTYRIRGLSEFQVSQQFQNKKEAVLSVETYSIRRGYSTKWWSPIIASTLKSVLNLATGANG